MIYYAHVEAHKETGAVHEFNENIAVELESESDLIGYCHQCLILAAKEDSDSPYNWKGLIINKLSKEEFDKSIHK